MSQRSTPRFILTVAAAAIAAAWVLDGLKSGFQADSTVLATVLIVLAAVGVVWTLVPRRGTSDGHRGGRSHEKG